MRVLDPNTAENFWTSFCAPDSSPVTVDFALVRGCPGLLHAATVWLSPHFQIHH